jgi:hypothetical protein
MIRWLRRNRSGDVRPAAATPPLPPRRIADLQDQMPPKPPIPLSAWSSQRGIHDPQYDPCGAGPARATGSGKQDGAGA